MDLSCFVVRSEEHISAEIDGEIVMMSIENGSYYGLDVIGARVWELIGEPIQIKKLCDLLVSEYVVEFNVCCSDLINFLSDLESQGLVKVLGRDGG